MYVTFFKPRIKKGRPDSSILKDLCMKNVGKLLHLATLIVAKWNCKNGSIGVLSQKVRSLRKVKKSLADCTVFNCKLHGKREFFFLKTQKQNFLPRKVNAVTFFCPFLNTPPSPRPPRHFFASCFPPVTVTFSVLFSKLLLSIF